MALYTGIHGDVIRNVGNHTYEVRTDLTACLVECERDENGEFFVDLPGNWCHTEEEAMEARFKARLVLSDYLGSLKPAIRAIKENGENR
jgi:hypothetical protein